MHALQLAQHQQHNQPPTHQLYRLCPFKARGLRLPSKVRMTCNKLPQNGLCLIAVSASLPVDSKIMALLACLEVQEKLLCQPACRFKNSCSASPPGDSKIVALPALLAARALSSMLFHVIPIWSWLDESTDAACRTCEMGRSIVPAQCLLLILRLDVTRSSRTLR